MEIRADYPFIYFQAEQNIVFVYRIETQNYVAVSDLIDDGKFETYEMDQQEDFETFNHRESQQIEGRSFFINQDDIAKMAEEINIHIQKKQHSQGPGPVHIVTSESAAGSLRAGLKRPKTVIGFPDSFSIGPLWKLSEKTGQNFRKEWLFDNINYEQEDFDYENKFRNTLREIEDTANHSPIYIWYGDNAEEQTGLRFYLYLLREKKNEIFLMNITELQKKCDALEDEPMFFHTGMLDSKILKLFFQNSEEEKALSEEKRIQYQREWKQLSETKGLLRVWKDDQIRTVPEDYYDLFIIKTVEKLHHEQENKDFILTGKVIGEIVAETDELIDYFFLEYRIRHLLYTGVFKLKGIPKSMRHYRIKIR